MTYISYSCVQLHALEYCKKKSWSNKKNPKFIIPYSEYEYESKFSKLVITATLPHGHCLYIFSTEYQYIYVYKFSTGTCK